MNDWLIHLTDSAPAYIGVLVLAAVLYYSFQKFIASNVQSGKDLMDELREQRKQLSVVNARLLDVVENNTKAMLQIAQVVDGMRGEIHALRREVKDMRDVLDNMKTEGMK